MFHNELMRVLSLLMELFGRRRRPTGHWHIHHGEIMLQVGFTPPAVFSWTGPVSCAWSDPANWSLGGTLKMKITGTQPGQFNQFSIAGTGTFAGAFQLAGNYAPTGAANWQVVTCGQNNNNHGEFRQPIGSQVPGYSESAASGNAVLVSYVPPGG